MIHKIDKASTEITAETEDKNNNQDMNREIRTGMATIKIEIGLTTEEDQTNISTTAANTKHRSSLSSQIKT